MTWLLKHDDNLSACQTFNCEDEAREWADDNIARNDRINWTLIDSEGGDWVV